LLELPAAKAARAVLRGPERRNALRLPDHHDIEVQNEQGRVLARARLPEGIAGITRLHAQIGQFAGLDTEPGEVAAGIETDRGLQLMALRAAGYAVYAINPRQVARYRELHDTSGAKGDKADAHAMAGMVRADSRQLRPVAGDSAGAEAIKVAARAHQTLIWERTRPRLDPRPLTWVWRLRGRRGQTRPGQY
jgi:transposase